MACPFMTTMKILLVLMVLLISFWKIFYQKYLLKKMAKTSGASSEQKTINVSIVESSKEEVDLPEEKRLVN
jgi:hypothetical protein